MKVIKSIIDTIIITAVVCITLSGIVDQQGQEEVFVASTHSVSPHV